MQHCIIDSIKLHNHKTFVPRDVANTSLIFHLTSTWFDTRLRSIMCRNYENFEETSFSVKNVQIFHSRIWLSAYTMDLTHVWFLWLILIYSSCFILIIVSHLYYNITYIWTSPSFIFIIFIDIFFLVVELFCSFFWCWQSLWKLSQKIAMKTKLYEVHINMRIICASILPDYSINCPVLWWKRITLE